MADAKKSRGQAWKRSRRLRNHEGVHMRDLFAGDQALREDERVFGSILLDYSKNIATDETFKLLGELVDAAGVWPGNPVFVVKINTEGRAVLRRRAQRSCRRSSSAASTMPEVNEVPGASRALSSACAAAREGTPAADHRHRQPRHRRLRPRPGDGDRGAKPYCKRDLKSTLPNVDGTHIAEVLRESMRDDALPHRVEALPRRRAIIRRNSAHSLRNSTARPSSPLSRRRR